MNRALLAGLTLTLALSAQPARRDGRPVPYTVTGCALLVKHGQMAEARSCYTALSESPNAYLRAEGLWGIQNYTEANNQFKIAIAENPPAAVGLVVRGEAPVALVFSTNTTGVSGVKVTGVFPADSHPPIVFPVAILRDSGNADAAKFFTFLTSAKAAAVFAKFGYRALAASH